ncbi:endoplasmic reticulum vesicle transporter-domain-containing protein [Entophlyctis helioformis]|nr:endoplasmic reticulum vesicle transporter-domain-containing protein [Entophlyctis helioformis]
MSEIRRRLSSFSGPTGGGGSGILAGLRKYDAYAKPLDDFRVRTVTGATVTLVSVALILFLTLSEFVDWYRVDMQPSLEVDKGRKEKMSININVTFPHIPCYLLSIDVMDVAGEHQNNLPHSMHKTRLDQMGNVLDKSLGELGANSTIAPDAASRNKTMDTGYCGSCYGGQAPAEGCCNTCEDVQMAYQQAGWSFTDPDSIEQCVKEGWSKKLAEQSHEACNVHGHIEVNKVQGNVHFAPGRSFQQNNMHVHDLHDYAAISNDLSFEHTVHSLTFGDPSTTFINPLNNVHKKPSTKFFTYQYFVKVVGTEVSYMNGTKVSTNQFSVTEHERDVTPAYGSMPTGMPGVFFNFEISPMLVKYKEYRKPFSHFLTDLCAIVGGVFTVAGMIDGLIYSAEKTLKAKLEIGKQS